MWSCAKCLEAGNGGCVNEELGFFWLIGILLNVLFFVAAFWWIRRELRRGRELRERRQAEMEAETETGESGVSRR